MVTNKYLVSILISYYVFQFYEYCDKWDENNKQQDEPDSVLSKFEKSELFLKTIADISSRLGLSEPVTDRQIKNIWDMCRYDKAWDIEKSSPWCSVR